MPLTTVSQGLLSTDAQYTGFKNRIINGAMMIDQRNNGASHDIIGGMGSGYYLPDRYFRLIGSIGATARLSTDAPEGFSSSLQLDVTLVYGGNFAFGQKIEGYNVSDFNLGTSNASSFSVSFMTKCSRAGTYSISFMADIFSGPYYVTTFSVNQANVWERKKITIPGATSGSSWSKTSDSGLTMLVTLIGGNTLQTSTLNQWTDTMSWSSENQTNLQTGDVFKITGVQLEKGSTATSFDYRPYGTEFALCQRYYQKLDTSAISNDNAVQNVYGGRQVNYYFPVNMRANPTVVGLNPNVTITNAFGMVQQCRFEAASGFYTQGYTASAEL